MEPGSSTQSTLGPNDSSDLPVSTWRLNPIIASLMVLLVSILVHLLHQDLRRRLRDSWDIFWPPWQHRDEVDSADERVAVTSGSGKKTERSSRRSQRDEGAARAPADGRLGSPPAAAKSPGRTRIERNVMRAKDEDIGAAGASQQIRIDELKVRTGPGNTSGPSTKEVAAHENAIMSTRHVTNAKSQSEKAQEGKSNPVDVPKDHSDNRHSEPTSDDPLMAGDYRPLRSILKKSKKKPRQSKNTHHNYFMAMRGSRAHLVPFPHGLHPPPSEPRHTLWWNNIPKNPDHLMAPPPVPKAVKDVLAGDDLEETTKKTEVVVTSGGSKASEVKGVKENTGQAEAAAIEEERARLRARMEAEQKAKITSTEKQPGTATASVSIEPAKQPTVPVDPQVQKATWASQAILCLFLFYIYQQLGLLLMVYFVWQQLNTMSENGITIPAPIATASARAAAPSAPESASKVPKREEIPPEMKEKLARAKREKESRASSESK